MVLAPSVSALPRLAALSSMLATLFFPFKICQKTLEIRENVNCKQALVFV
jgi:hypothetical protein